MKNEKSENINNLNNLCLIIQINPLVMGKTQNMISYNIIDCYYVLYLENKNISLRLPNYLVVGQKIKCQFV